MSTLFISHSAPDFKIAEALENAINELSTGCAEPINIRYSSSAGNGPQGGEEWREWIERQIVKATTVLVVLSRESVTRHWPIWEAAACRGVALQRKQENKDSDSPKIIALMYGITNEECPDPFKKEQIFSGVTEERMCQVFEKILEIHGMETGVLLQAGRNMDGVVKKYTEKVEKTLLNTPSLVTEASVQDWLIRLDKLVKDQRWSELESYQHWMNIAFGHDDKENMQRQIDLRLHRRLGDYHLERSNFKSAIEQLQLARESAPRDIYILSRLTESLIKQVLENETSNEGLENIIIDLLKRIESLDSKALYASADTAALAAKYHRRIKGDSKKAIAIYQEALSHQPDSYYLADVLGQTQIEDQQFLEAKETYKNALEILDRLPDHSIWSLATKATANLVLDKILVAVKIVDEIIELNPTQNQLASIKEGLEDVSRKMNIDEKKLENLLGKMK